MSHISEQHKALSEYLVQEQKIQDILSNKGFIYTQYLDQVLKFKEEKEALSQNDGLQYQQAQELIQELEQLQYSDIQLIGKGAFGKVFSGKRGVHRFAIKGFDQNNENNGDDQGENINEQIINEFNIQQACKDCKYIVRVEKIEKAIKNNFIVMEECFINLQTLLKMEIVDNENQRVQMNEFSFVKIAFELISGIAYLHKKSIAVKDLKPDNILVNYNYVFQIGDFGLSQLIITPKSQQFLMQGNLFYMSPERRRLHMQMGEEYKCSKMISKELKEINQLEFLIKGDIFSLGLILCELILGDQPFANIFGKFFINEYKDFNSFLDLVYNRMMGFKHQNQLFDIIKSFCELSPQNRMSASTALSQISMIHTKFGLNDLRSKKIEQQIEQQLFQTFKDDIEVINTYHDKNIIVFSEQILNTLNNNSCYVATFNKYNKNNNNNTNTNNFTSTVFLKKLKTENNTYKSLTSSNLSQQNTLATKFQSSLKIIKNEDQKQMNNNNHHHLKNQTSIEKKMPETEKTQTTQKTIQVCTTNEDINKYKQSTKLVFKKNTLQDKEKNEFLSEINRLIKDGKLDYSFKEFKKIIIETLPFLKSCILFFVIGLISLFEIECVVSEYWNTLPELHFLGIYILRFSLTSLQTLFGSFLISKLLLANYKFHFILKFMMSLLLVLLFTSLSIYINSIPLFNFSTNNDLLQQYSAGFQAIVFFLAVWLLLLTLNRKQVKIMNLDDNTEYSFYFFKKDLFLKYQKIGNYKN